MVRKITQKLPPQLEKYGVFVDAGFDEIVSTVAESGLTGVQIHRSSEEFCSPACADILPIFPGGSESCVFCPYKEPANTNGREGADSVVCGFGEPLYSLLCSRLESDVDFTAWYTLCL